MTEEYIDSTHKDVAHSWVSTSRFIWFCQVFLAVAFLVGISYGLYCHRYKGKPDVEVPSNTLYNPQYK